jgi:hypothetical protein
MYTLKELRERSNTLLTLHVQEKMQHDLIYAKLFPEVVVNELEVEKITFGNEALRIYENLKRAPFAPSNIMAPENIQREVYGLDEYDVMFPVDYQQKKSVIQGSTLSQILDLKKRAAMKAAEILELRKEKDCATIALAADSYGDDNKKIMTSSTSWYDEDNANMIDDVRAARAAIVDGCGHEPNIGVFGSLSAFHNVVEKSYFLERVKYGGNHVKPGIVTKQTLADILGLDEIVVAKSYYLNDSNDKVNVWGDYFILAYVRKPRSLSNLDDADTFGVTYKLKGMPIIDEVKNENSSKGLNKIEYERATSFHKHLGMNFNAAYLFANTTLEPEE